jgi:phage baseplate assembly protein W
MATKRQPIGITFPLQRGDSGYFNQSFDVVDQIKANLYLLFNTKRGERRLNLDFGSTLWEIIFEFNNEELPTIVEQAIKNDVKKWIPYVNVESVSIETTDKEKDQGYVKIQVSFTADSVGISSPQSLTIITPQNNI